MPFYSIQVEIQFGYNTVDESQFNEKKYFMKQTLLA